MDENQNKHRLNIADMITLLRITGTMLLLVLRPLTAEFYWVYALTGLTDVLDGWIARTTKTASDFGAKLDSIADLMFYTVMLLRLFPNLWVTLPGQIWFAVVGIVVVRMAAYLTAAVKYRRFASLHTKLNKLTGIVVFLVPFLLATRYAVEFCWIVCFVATASSLEELVIHLRSRAYFPNARSREKNMN